MTIEKLSFEEATKKASEQTSNTIFVKLNDGDTIKGMFAGDVLTKVTHYIQGQNKSVDCIGDGCQYCEQGIKSNVKYYQNFIVYNEKDKKYEVKIFGLSPVAMKSLKESLLLSEIPRERAVVAVKRTGEKLETEYHFQVVKNTEVPPVELLTIEDII